MFEPPFHDEGAEVDHSRRGYEEINGPIVGSWGVQFGWRDVEVSTSVHEDLG